jgi:putative ABC transport system permease protein
MIALAWHTARARKASLLGSFIALALGVALLSAMASTIASTVGSGGSGPRWYTRADVVLAGTDAVRVVTGTGDDRETETVPTTGSAALPADLPARLSTRLSTTDGARQVVDYAGYAQAPGAPGDTVHPWSAAGLHDYAWQAGGPPTGAGQVVLTAPTAHRPGDRIVVRTALGSRDLTVSGVLRTGAPAALYVADPLAAQLSGGRIQAIALVRQPGTGTTVASLAAQARAVAGGQVRVLTGDRRRAAEPDPDAELFAVAVSLLGTTSGLAGFVSVFVVAGTFAYAVAARRREFGLLRTAGATPRQVRRLILSEALVVGVLAGLAGDALGTVLAPPFAHWLARSGFAPTDFTAHLIFWPLAAAFGVGLLVALAGAALAARRAGRVRPVEALREAEVDRNAMTLGRWLVGLAAFGGSVPLIIVLAHAHSADATALILVVAMLLIIGCAMFAPLLIPPLVWLFTVPLSGSAGATGMLARRNAIAAVRRTAATAAPILVTVGIAGSTLSGFATLNGTEASAARHRITAPAVIVPGDGQEGLADATTAAVRAVPGVTAAVPALSTTVYLRGGGDANDYDARYLPGPELAGVLDLPVTAGSLADLTGTGTVAVPAGVGRLGQTIALWLDDSVRVRLRVVAVLANQIDLSDTILLPWALRAGHTGRPLADTIYLGLSGSADRAAVARAAEAGGGTMLPTADYLSTVDDEQNRTNNLAMTAVLGLALLYTIIAIANTLVMATGERGRELATLRLAGATPRQLRRMIGLESVLVAAIGILLGGVVTAVTLLGMRAGLSSVAPAVRVLIPWRPVGGIAAACLVVAVLASLIPAALVLRRPPIAAAAVRQ